MTLSAAEQYLIELINRARLDPLAEAQRYGLDLNSGLAAGQIGTAALQVVAPNAHLEAAAKDHSDWMLTTNTFSHTGAAASQGADRMQAAGYQFTGVGSWRENLAWVGSTGTVNMKDAIDSHHAGLYRSPGHRSNTFSDTVREVGIGQENGSFTYNGTTYNSSMLTQKFALSGPDVSVTGVAYRDRDANDFYSMGEANNGIWLAINGQAGAVAAPAGGYAVKGAALDETRVIVGETGPGGGRIAWLDMDLSEGNAKLDVVTTAQGGYRVDVSVDTTLAAGISHGRLLGSADLDLTGSTANNRLEGNRGDNLLEGRGGNDRLEGRDGDDWLDGGDGHDLIFGGEGHDILAGRFGADQLYGGNGHDRLWGGHGPDVLDGGAGNDRMEGGPGHDTFIFSGHHDIIADFQDDIDTIWVRDKVWGGTEMTVKDILAMGHIENGNAIIDFPGNHSLTIWGVTDLATLANDMVIV